MKKLSIIIITLNEEKNIQNILKDLSHQTFQDFEIIISDSNSSDATAKKAQEMGKCFTEFRFDNCGKTLGPSFGRNYGEQFAKYEQLLFLDADTRIREHDFLERLLQNITLFHADAGSFYFKLTTRGILPFLGYKLMNFGLFITQYLSPTACGAFLFSTKAVHKKVGGFREDVQLCEDCDYVRDAKRAGFHVRMLPMACEFSDRRLQQDGFFRTGIGYLKANLIRFTTGKSIKKTNYTFGNYE